MAAKLHLHVRTLPNKRVVVTPVPLCWCSRDGASYEEARAAAVGAARERLSELSGSERSILADDATATLDTVRVKYRQTRGDAKKKGRERIGLTMGLVVVERVTTSGPLRLVCAPEVPGFEFIVREPGPLPEAIAGALLSELKGWDPSEVLACDEAGEVRLEELELEFPRTAATGVTSPVHAAADDLTSRAAAGRLGRLDRRDPLVERVLAALAADGRASVMLVGASDVGKSTLTNEIAARLSADEVPPALRGRVMLRISADDVVAGARWLGDWQERVRQLITMARDTKAIVALGDPTAVVGAGRSVGNDNNVGRALRPHIDEGEIRLICETTPDGLAAARKMEPGFVEAFHRIDVPEPDADASAEILHAAARRLEANHDVAFADDAVRAALELTRRFEPYRALPGKAVRLLEETAQLTSTEDGHGRLGRDEVVRAFAQRSGMPLAMLSDEVDLRTDDVLEFFEQRVLGQDEAVRAMVDLVAVIKAGLNDPGKPLGTFLSVGPTGVGKTELTKALAEYLFGSRDRVLRFDMGEYASGDALPRLVGSAWQREDQGQLTRRVREQPFCVVLLDEIEKAHRDVFDVLLSALGEGRLTDSSGRTADLRNAIVVMTSNLGAARHEVTGVGFADVPAGSERERRQRHFVEQAERFFRPEFVNRIDRILAFEPLDRETIRRIARRELGRLLMREGITRRRLLVEIDDAVVERLADVGFNPQYGARPLHREIERAVIQPLARLIVEQHPASGDLVRLRVAGGEIALEVHRVREPRPAAAVVHPEPGAPEPSFARAAAQAAELAERVRAQLDEPPAGPVRQELSELLDRANAPGFWDEPDAARATLARLYQLQLILDDLQHLHQRAEGLAELGREVGASRDRARLGEVRQALTEVADQLELVRLELAGAAAGPDDPAVELTFTPVGAESGAWAAELQAMYAAWAQRAGREVRMPPGSENSLVIEGAGSYALRAHEAGLHRRDGADRSRRLVRVAVAAVGAAARNGAEDPGTVVRIYADGHRTGVRDPRTRVTVGNVRAVLELGRIDAFILAALAIDR
jgi:ATP-dependent Clp protease ATP-binding subunit ClpC